MQNTTVNPVSPVKNFYQLTDHVLFDCQTYLDRWHMFLNLVTPEGSFNEKASQSLGDLSRNLWSMYNLERSEQGAKLSKKYYMDSDTYLKPYMASFLLPNIERIFSLFSSGENARSLQELLSRPRAELVCADFGAGPLSASIGLLCAIKFLAAGSRKIYIPDKIVIYVIERSPKIVKIGAQLLIESAKYPGVFDIQHVASAKQIPKLVDIVLCANVFNEIPAQHHTTTLEALYDKVVNRGLLLVVEPAQDVHAKALGRLRDAFLKQQTGCRIIGPCTHTSVCPLATEGRKDWCWFRHAWDPPESLQRIEISSRQDHRNLNFSYVLFQKLDTPRVEAQLPSFHGPSRVVSDGIRIDLSQKSTADYLEQNCVSGDFSASYDCKDGQTLKFLLCTGAGLYSALCNDAEIFSAERGSYHASTDDFPFIFEEKLS